MDSRINDKNNYLTGSNFIDSNNHCGTGRLKHWKNAIAGWCKRGFDLSFYAKNNLKWSNCWVLTDKLPTTASCKCTMCISVYPSKICTTAAVYLIMPDLATGCAVYLAGLA